MEATSAYIIAVIISVVILIVSVIIATAIKFKGGANPRDRKKRKLWFWVLAFINPAVIYLLGYFVFKPDANLMVVNNYLSALGIGTIIGFFLYIIAGLILSRLFPNTKIGNWF